MVYSIHYRWNDVSIDGEKLTPSNIDNYDLHKRFESEIANIYCTKPRSKYGQFIIYVKDPKRFAKNNDYLLQKGYKTKSPYVSWFEGEKEGYDFENPLDEQIEYIKERL